jgi:hypothetical protein
MNSSVYHEEIQCYYSSNQVDNNIENQPLPLRITTITKQERPKETLRNIG